MFDYLGVLISVILGMALTHLLKGVNKMVQMRGSVKPYWVHMIWTFNVLIYVLAVWWGMFWWKRLEVWAIEQFLFLSGYSIVLFLLAGMLYPMEAAEDLDFEEYFFANKSWFFGTQILAFLIDIPETLLKETANLRAVPSRYLVFVPTILALNVIGLLSSNRRLHGLLCLTWLAVFLSYLTFSSLDHISA